MRKYQIYAIGNALVDYEIEVTDKFLWDHSVEKSVMTLVDEPHQEKLIRSSSGHIKKRQAGGSVANSVVAMAQLGTSAYFSCKVADDDDGRLVLSDLTAYGIDSNLDIDKLNRGITGKCLIMITPDAERTMNTHLGITSHLSDKEVVEDAIKNSHMVFIEGYLISTEEGRKAIKRTMECARKHATKVAFTFSDPSMVKYFNQSMHELLQEKIDLLFCNEEEAILFTGEESIEKAQNSLKNFATNFVITQGKNGATIWDGETYIKIEPYAVKAIDSTGAGDMFAGAFLHGLSRGHNLASCGKLASKLSSLVVGQYGPRLDYEIMVSTRDGIFKQ